MKSKSTYFLVLFCSLTIFSWLILTEAHPTDGKDEDPFSDSFGLSSNKVSVRFLQTSRHGLTHTTRHMSR